MKSNNTNVRKHLTEQTIMFASVAKWIVISSLIGAVIGSIVAYFLKLLAYGEMNRGQLPFDYYLLLPFALMLAVTLVRKFAPAAEGHGTEKVIEAVHKHSGKMNFVVVPVKLLSTALTIFSGGSVGKEGPSAQIGAATASLLASVMKFRPKDREKVVICGISAGFASVFGTPIAGAIFGVEILIVGALMYDVLLPSIVSGFAAFYAAKFFGIEYTYFDIAFYTNLDFDFFLLLKVVAGGIFFGLVADFFITVIRSSHRYIETLPFHYLTKAFGGGVILLLLTLVVGEAYLGLGFSTIQDALSPDGSASDGIPGYAFILKSIFTAVTLGSGGSGGVITPIFFVGATSGNVFGHMVGGDIPFFAALGFVSVLAGTTNAPIAAMILSVELFGMNVTHYAALAIIISFLMTGHRSVFPSQLLAMRKSEALNVKLGDEIVNADATHTTRFFKNMKKIFGILLNFCCGGGDAERSFPRLPRTPSKKRRHDA
ncbi:chloride channel protein [Sulfurimonas diazotrophicus]|uniref:Chloride channel protein n=1 Tax=Sulfurimonas diazotrophicus TaxID=3131939 RepID=A0ABZ3H9X5_9BACT